MSRARRRAPGPTRNRRGEATRKTILATAERLLEKEGFEAVSIDRVARAAGVTRSSIYHQFRGRDEFLLHLIAESLRRLQRRDPRSAPRSAVRRFLAEAEAGFHADPNLLRMFYQLVFDRAGRRPAVDALLREAYRFRTARYAEGLRRDAPLGAREARALAIVLAAALDGLYARRLVDFDPADVRDAFRTLAALVEGRLRAAAPSSRRIPTKEKR